MATNDSKKGGGQKILTVIVGVVVAVFTVIMIIAAVNTKGGGTSSDTAAKTYKKADVVGCWKVKPDNMKKGYSQYLILTDDGKAKQYQYLAEMPYTCEQTIQLKGDTLDWYNDGKYTVRDNKIKVEYTQYDFVSDIKDTNINSYKLSFGINSAKKNTLKLSVEGDNGRIVMTFNRIDESKVKPIADAATKKLDDLTAATMPKEHTFSAGNYICGQDFEEGVYNLVAVSGSGNVMCDDEEINEVMGTDPEFDTQTYKNATFVEGDLLEIKGNLQLRLEP